MELFFTISGLLIAIYFYTKRLFLDQVTYSANIIDQKTNETGSDKWLLIRTIHVIPVNEILPNNILFRLNLLWAIHKCDEMNMFIRMKRNSMNVLQPAIINGLASVTGASTLNEVSGIKMAHKKVLIAITFERYGDIKSQKIRVMVVSPETLQAINDGSIDIYKLRLESDQHKNRIETLVKMAAIWKKEKISNQEEIKIVVEVEIPC